MSQGLAQTNGPQLFARAMVRVGDVQAGVQWKNIDSASANGVGALFVKLRQNIGKLQLEVGAAYRIRTGATSNIGAWEFSGGARRNFGRLSMRIYTEYSPNEFGSGTSLYVELGPRFDLDKSTQFSANAGFRKRDGGPDYRSSNIGLTRVIGRGLSIDGRYYRTDRAKLGPSFAPRIIFSVRVAR